MLEQKLVIILIKVKLIALVGASDKVDRPSYKVMKYLINQGYNVTPISPIARRRRIAWKKSLCTSD